VKGFRGRWGGGARNLEGFGGLWGWVGVKGGLGGVLGMGGGRGFVWGGRGVGGSTVNGVCVRELRRRGFAEDGPQ
jgi:hypothetical protein